MAALGLHCCTWALSSCRKQGLHTSWGPWAFHCCGFSCCLLPFFFPLQLNYVSFPNATYCCAHVCSVTQLCLTPCDPMDCSHVGSSLHGIFQARILVWVAMPSSKGSSYPGLESSLISCIVGIFFNAEPWGNPLLYYCWLYIDIPGLLWFSSISWK